MEIPILRSTSWHKLWGAGVFAVGLIVASYVVPAGASDPNSTDAKVVRDLAPGVRFGAAALVVAIIGLIVSKALDTRITRNEPTTASMVGTPVPMSSDARPMPSLTTSDGTSNGSASPVHLCSVDASRVSIRGHFRSAQSNCTIICWASRSIYQDFHSEIRAFLERGCRLRLLLCSPNSSGFELARDREGSDPSLSAIAAAQLDTWRGEFSAYIRDGRLRLYTYERTPVLRCFVFDDRHLYYGSYCWEEKKKGFEKPFAYLDKQQGAIGQITYSVLEQLCKDYLRKSKRI